MQAGREIKFWAWDTETKKMSHDFLNKNWLRVCIESPFVELMQFTGLRDSNDKEIYKGNVVLCDSRSSGKERRVVCYDLHQLKYKTVPLVAYHSNAGRGGWTGYEVKYHNEVIGNIYEKPELLEAI
ncbi:YopX family protein [Brevibacillus sp. NPDC003359]|uniref:YopX family protein n=1 Tax=unclassified Brevibacillus TaxID=2684853 RepID=UPI0036848D8A